MKACKGCEVLLAEKSKVLSSQSSLEPDIPDIKERHSFSSRQLSEEEQIDRIRKLESYVEQLEEEIEHLRKMKDELADVKANPLTPPPFLLGSIPSFSLSLVMLTLSPPFDILRWHIQMVVYRSLECL